MHHHVTAAHASQESHEACHSVFRPLLAPGVPRASTVLQLVAVLAESWALPGLLQGRGQPQRRPRPRGERCLKRAEPGAVWPLLSSTYISLSLTAAHSPFTNKGPCIFIFHCKSCGRSSWWALQKRKVSVAQSCPALCDSMDGSPPGSSVHGILQARSHSLLQGIFPTQGSNKRGKPNCKQPDDRQQVLTVFGEQWRVCVCVWMSFSHLLAGLGPPTCLYRHLVFNPMHSMQLPEAELQATASRRARATVLHSQAGIPFGLLFSWWYLIKLDYPHTPYQSLRWKRLRVSVCLCVPFSLQLPTPFFSPHFLPLCCSSCPSLYTDHWKPKKSDSFESNHIQLSPWWRSGPGGRSRRASWMGSTAGVKQEECSAPRKLPSQPVPDKVPRHRQTPRSVFWLCNFQRYSQVKPAIYQLQNNKRNTWGFLGGSVVKNLPANDPWVRRSPVEGTGNPLQYSCLGNPTGQRSLTGYSPWGHKESDMT